MIMPARVSLIVMQSLMSHGPDPDDRIAGTRLRILTGPRPHDCAAYETGELVIEYPLPMETQYIQLPPSTPQGEMYARAYNAHGECIFQSGMWDIFDPSRPLIDCLIMAD